MLKPVFDHRLMLTDAVRLDAYRRASLESASPGDVVADPGTGSGILAFLAVLSGAGRVYAIEADAALI